MDYFPVWKYRYEFVWDDLSQAIWESWPVWEFNPPSGG